MGTEADIPATHQLMHPLTTNYLNCCWNHCTTTALNISLALQHFFDEDEYMEVTRWYVQAVWGMVQHLQVHGVLLERVGLMTIVLCNMITVIVSMPGHFLLMR
jgi:hypothetical protein